MGTERYSTMPMNLLSAVCNSSMLLLRTPDSDLYICSLDTHVSGLKWYTAGTGVPEYGKEVMFVVESRHQSILHQWL